MIQTDDKMKEILDFMVELSKHNNKPWFDEHKAEYKAIRAQFEEFAMELLHGVEEFEPRVHDLTVKDITYRINRDIRFSKDKSPYKTWWGVYVCPKGKKSGMAGYYVHFEPCNNLYFVCGGLYNPTKEVVQSVREAIMLEPEEFHEAVQVCGEDFVLNWDGALKRIPAGYNEADKHSEYYRLRSYEIYKPLSKRDVLKKDFLKNALAELKKTQRFNELLNKCYDYAYDEEK